MHLARKKRKLYFWSNRNKYTKIYISDGKGSGSDLTHAALFIKLATIVADHFV